MYFWTEAKKSGTSLHSVYPDSLYEPNGWKSTCTVTVKANILLNADRHDFHYVYIIQRFRSFFLFCIVVAIHSCTYTFIRFTDRMGERKTAQKRVRVYMTKIRNEIDFQWVKPRSFKCIRNQINTLFVGVLFMVYVYGTQTQLTHTHIFRKTHSISRQQKVCLKE